MEPLSKAIFQGRTVLALVMVWFGGLGLLNLELFRHDYDEGQYIALAQAIAQGEVPFRDFFYHQPSYFLHLLVASRASTAEFMALSVARPLGELAHGFCALRNCPRRFAAAVGHSRTGALLRVTLINAGYAGLAPRFDDFHNRPGVLSDLRARWPQAYCSGCGFDGERRLLKASRNCSGLCLRLRTLDSAEIPDSFFKLLPDDSGCGDIRNCGNACFK